MADEPGFGHAFVLSGATLAGGVALFGVYRSIVPEFLGICRDAAIWPPVRRIHAARAEAPHAAAATPAPAAPTGTAEAR
jgi:hypothetical protein